MSGWVALSKWVTVCTGVCTTKRYGPWGCRYTGIKTAHSDRYSEAVTRYSETVTRYSETVTTYSVLATYTSHTYYQCQEW